MHTTTLEASIAYLNMISSLQHRATPQYLLTNFLNLTRRHIEQNDCEGAYLEARFWYVCISLHLEDSAHRTQLPIQVLLEHKLRPKNFYHLLFRRTFHHEVLHHLLPQP